MTSPPEPLSVAHALQNALDTLRQLGSQDFPGSLDAFKAAQDLKTAPINSPLDQAVAGILQLVQALPKKPPHAFPKYPYV
jgi:hypothetical protein